MFIKYLIITALWAGFCFLHSLMISIWFTNILKRLLKKYYAFYRLFYVLVFTLLIFPLISFTSGLDHEAIITYSKAFNISRYILMVFGMLVFVKAFLIDYDVLHFFGIRQALDFNKTKKEPAETELKKAGCWVWLGIQCTLQL